MAIINDWLVFVRFWGSDFEYYGFHLPNDIFRTFSYNNLNEMALPDEDAYVCPSEVPMFLDIQHDPYWILDPESGQCFTVKIMEKKTDVVLVAQILKED